MPTTLSDGQTPLHCCCCCFYYYGCSYGFICETALSVSQNDTTLTIAYCDWPRLVLEKWKRQDKAFKLEAIKCDRPLDREYVRACMRAESAWHWLMDDACGDAFDHHESILANYHIGICTKNSSRDMQIWFSCSWKWYGRYLEPYPGLIIFGLW